MNKVTSYASTACACASFNTVVGCVTCDTAILCVNYHIIMKRRCHPKAVELIHKLLCMPHRVNK